MDIYKKVEPLLWDRTTAIFDFDETLAPTDEAYWECFLKHSQLLGVQLTPEDKEYLRDKTTGNIKSAINKLSNLKGITIPDSEILVVMKLRREALKKNVKPYTVMTKILKEAKEDFSINTYLVTNNSPCIIMPFLCENQLTKYFNYIICLCSPYGTGRPDKEQIYKNILDTSWTTPDRIILFDDCDTWLSKASALGITTVGIKTSKGLHKKEEVSTITIEL